MKIDELNEIYTKADTKSDGVYSHKGYMYAVCNNKPIAFYDHYGDSHLIMGSFTMPRGSRVEYKSDQRKNLLEMIKEYKKLKCY